MSLSLWKEWEKEGGGGRRVGRLKGLQDFISCILPTKGSLLCCIRSCMAKSCTISRTYNSMSRIMERERKRERERGRACLFFGEGWVLRTLLVKSFLSFSNSFEKVWKEPPAVEFSQRLPAGHTMQGCRDEGRTRQRVALLMPQKRTSLCPSSNGFYRSREKKIETKEKDNLETRRDPFSCLSILRSDATVSAS